MANFPPDLRSSNRAVRINLAPVIPIGALARYDRPTPTLADYDQLLNRSTP